MKKHYLKYLLLIFITINTIEIFADDVFCGELKIYKQKWLAKTSITITALNSVDLKQCLNSCCKISGIKKVI